MAQDNTKDDTTDEDVHLLGDYNNVSPPTPVNTDLEEYYKTHPAPPPVNTDDDLDDSKPHRTLNFDSGQNTPSLLQQLRDKLAANIQKSGQTGANATDEMVDELRMAANPALQGPRLPLGSGVNSIQQSKDLTNSVPMVGSLGLVKAATPGIEEAASALVPKLANMVRSTPWMQNASNEAIQAAVPAGEGLANSAKDTIYTQAAKQLAKLRALERMKGN